MSDPFWKLRPFEYLSEYAFSILLFVASLFAGNMRRILQWMRNTRAEHWTVTTGTITTGDVKAFHGKVNDYAVGKLGYSYNVNGNYYSGYFSHQFNDEQRAWDFVDARKNSQALIRYKPEHPEVSVLRQFDQQQWPPELPFNLWTWIPVRLRSGKRHWPTVEGVVESVGLRRLDSDEGGGLVNELVFSYAVNEMYYSGIFRYSPTSADNIEEWTGKKVLIHYLREDPSKSILFLDEQHQTE